MSTNAFFGSIPGGIGGMPAAAVVGLVCAGLQLISPDHLCTLMSLSSTATDTQALRIGAAWGLSHTVGTIAICAALVILKKVVPINMEVFERFGDYIIGCSLVLCSLYFVSKESKYLVTQTDGSLQVQACDCHGFGSDGSLPSRLSGPQREATRGTAGSKTKFCESFKNAGKCCDGNDCAGVNREAIETAPLLGEPVERVDKSLIAGAILGLVQGLCCPMVLVSANFVAYVPTFFTLAVFIVVFSVVSVMSTSLLAFLWARLMGTHLSPWVSPRVIYRGSCVITFFFGLLWICANRFGFLGKINYSEGFVSATAAPNGIQAKESITLGSFLDSGHG